MRKSIYLYAMLLAMPVIALMSSCEPRELTEEDVFVQESSLDQILQDENQGNGYKIYDLNEFLDTFMTEEGTYHNDTTPYRDRSYDATHGIYLYSVDTLRAGGAGIYIRGRIATDDYAGNFYKSMVIQQIVNGEQQNLRISVDLGSSAGMYQLGQEIIIRCNGLAVGRYANQPQLCIPSYNNNIYAMNASEKVGWCPGRIQGSVFRRATRMIGKPDPSKLQYDVLSLSQLFTEIPRKPTADATGMDKVVYLPTNILTACRNEIMGNTERWLACVQSPGFLKTFGEPGSGDADRGFGLAMLKTCPSGFPRDYVHLRYLRMKDYCCWTQVPDDFFEGDAWLEKMVKVFKIAKPMLDFVNAVIDDYE